jgi:hypothetical protein
MYTVLVLLFEPFILVPVKDDLLKLQPALIRRSKEADKPSSASKGVTFEARTPRFGEGRLIYRSLRIIVVTVLTIAVIVVLTIAVIVGLRTIVAIIRFIVGVIGVVKFRLIMGRT